MSRHCPGCVKAGKLEALKRITVYGDECPGCDPDGEIVKLTAELQQARELINDLQSALLAANCDKSKALSRVADVEHEMNEIIRSKWEIEGKYDKAVYKLKSLQAKERTP